MAFLIIIFSILKTVEEPVDISVYPANPIVYLAENRWCLNFDFWIKNNLDVNLELTYLELKIYNKNGQLTQKRYLSNNGLPGSLSTIETKLESGDDLYVFNPFHSLRESTEPSRLIYTFYFGTHQYGVEVFPFIHNPLTHLELPVQGQIFIDDGNDYYSHHRRVSLNSQPARDLGMNSLAQRFALDFTKINKQGNRRNNQLTSNADWYAWAMGVFAPGDGVIISLRNDVPDNRYENGSLVYSETFESSSADDTSTGNYLLIDHQNGEYSLLCHFLERSIVPSIGDRVQQGDFIGKIGMSGDTYYPHLHYQLQNSPDILHSEGLPILFRNYQDAEKKKMKKGYLNSGDIVHN
ncbi:MAG: M23 family metallopeptidase [Bacteroidota bacterium]